MCDLAADADLAAVRAVLHRIARACNACDAAAFGSISDCNIGAVFAACHRTALVISKDACSCAQIFADNLAGNTDIDEFTVYRSRCQRGYAARLIETDVDIGHAQILEGRVFRPDKQCNLVKPFFA